MGLLAAPAFADDITEAMEQARKAYQSGDLTNAKQSLDLASQLIGQKNAEAFAALLPNALPGWKAEKPQTTAIGASGFGASVASRNYQNAKGDNVSAVIFVNVVEGDHFREIDQIAGPGCDHIPRRARRPSSTADRPRLALW